MRKFFISLSVLFINQHCLQAQKYKVYSAAGSYGMGPLAIYEYKTQKKLTEFIYSEAKIVNDTYFIVKESGDNTAQLLNPELKIIIPKGKFSSIRLSETMNYATVTASDPNPNDAYQPFYGIYDIKQNKLIVPCKYNYIGQVNENGFAAFNKGGKDMMPQLVQGGKWSYLNINGTELFPPKYTWCSEPNNQNVGCAYINGNSNDGLYGGYWTLVDMNGKILIDDNKYYLAERDPYNTPPGKLVQLNRKNGEHAHEYIKDNIIATCDGKIIKEINEQVDYIFETEGLIEVSSGSDNNGDRQYGLVDLSGKIHVPLNYHRIEKFGDSFILTKTDGTVYYLENLSGNIKSLGIKESSQLSYDDKEEKGYVKTERLSEKEKYSWLLYGKADNNLYSFYDINFKKVLSDVDSGNGYKGNFSTNYYDEPGTYFLFYAGKKVNYFNSSGKKLITGEFSDLENKFDRKMFDKREKNDSAFAKKDGKWGLISTKQFTGNQFIYDSINVLNEKFTIAKRNNNNYIINEGTLDAKLGGFEKIIATYNTSHAIPRKKDYHYTYAHVIAHRKNTDYLLELSCSFWYGNRLITSIADSGKISKVEGNLYLKNNNLHFLWSNSLLPKGTTQVTSLSEWTAKSDIVIYAYENNNLWGIIDEDGKVIQPPKYKTLSEIHDPPANFNYVIKAK